jgi:hypothetical protein
MTRFCGVCCEEDVESSGLDGEHWPPVGPNDVTGAEAAAHEFQTLSVPKTQSL